MVADQPPATTRTPIGNPPARRAERSKRARSRIRREVGGGGSSAPLTSSRGGSRNTTTGNLIRQARTNINKAPQNPERVIAVELILAEAIYIGVTLYLGSAPTPRVMAALLAVYAILGLLSVFGPSWGRVAYLFGGLVIIGIAFHQPLQDAMTKYKIGKQGTIS